ncbi:hypothetical protein GCHA_2524 [Paraglaciecola chathamensis S18K6]|uniref:Uncharacterized protein n=2 Tax=Paraglaciecola chathamensis TaxID=368405 RepID=A0ABQ0IBE6_9ALTE|nr:hypothetical protein GAGA_3879 [Paraglaciecola agarilytica NO2]GAC10471.1 hypothetical protein GCHA_2524 [Paraglaciecola chathamensis S18K6]
MFGVNDMLWIRQLCGFLASSAGSTFIILALHKNSFQRF